MVSTVWVNVWVNGDHRRDLHPLIDHTIEQALTNLIVSLLISPKNYIQKLHKQASMLQWILGRFVFWQN